MEGQDAAVEAISGLFCSIGNEVCRIDGAKKAKYHAAASILSNQVIAVLDMGYSLLEDCGFIYLFLHRDKRTFTSERQKNLLFRAARLYWEQKYADSEVVPKRKVDCELYKYVLYYLEVRQVFLDPKLSLKKLSDMIETNQTYLSNVVNRYFGCHLKELVNTYRVEYAKELLRSGKCPPEELPQRCGFLSRSAFYAAFKKVTGVSPKRYMKYGQREKLSEPTEYV